MGEKEGDGGGECEGEWIGEAKCTDLAEREERKGGEGSARSWVFDTCGWCVDVGSGVSSSEGLKVVCPVPEERLAS